MNKRILLLNVITMCVITSVVFSQCGTQKSKRTEADESGSPNAWDASIKENSRDMIEKGRAVFRYETFGDEAFWTDKLQLHKIIPDRERGGIGDGLTPRMALDLGLKVDLDILPMPLREQIKEGKLFNDVGLTLTLLKLNAVLGIVGKFEDGNLKSIGITCALCH